MAKVCTTLVVSAVPALSVKSITLSPTSINLGQTVVATIIVQNTGTGAGAGTLVLTMSGTELAREITGVIAAGGTKTFSWSFAPSVAGTYTVCAEVV